MKFENLKLFPHPDKFQHKELFPNCYGVSVILENDPGEEPLYEVAVLRHYGGKKAHLCYTTVITNDVIRYCTMNAVETLIESIRNLPLADG